MDALSDSPILQHVLGAALPQLRLFHVKLSREGEPRGIIGPRDVDIIWERHVLNSAAIVPYIRDAVRRARYATVADVGSGGGFPGIVAAACLPECSFTLIEPMERRIEWLRECVQELGLSNVSLFHGRSEELIADIRRHQAHPFAAVTCRAVAPMTKLVGWTLPLLRSHGRLIALKGKSAAMELDKASNQIRQFHGCHAKVMDAEVGPQLPSTYVVSMEKQ